MYWIRSEREDRHSLASDEALKIFDDGGHQSSTLVVVVVVIFFVLLLAALTLLVLLQAVLLLFLLLGYFFAGGLIEEDVLSDIRLGSFSLPRLYLSRSFLKMAEGW
jgi:hypothetical protein